MSAKVLNVPFAVFDHNMDELTQNLSLYRACVWQ